MVSVLPLNIKNSLAPTPTQSPQYAISLKTKSNESLDLADPDYIRAIVACMDMNAVLGGAACHYGGPAAFAELMSATHAFAFFKSQKSGKEFFELFNIVNDAGHCENGLYALKAMYNYADLSLNSLKNFRSIKSKLTGHGESHLFPDGVLLSNGPLGSAFPQAQGLAMADALAENQRTTILAISDGASMEGEAKEAFSAIPGFAARGKLNPFICILSDNNTKLTGRIDKDSFSMQGYFSSLKEQGWHVISLENGNDLEACLKAIEEAHSLSTKNPKIPVLIHARTTKGIGTKKTAESSSGGHGFPLKTAAELRGFVSEILNGKELPSEIDSWITELENTTPAASQPGEKIQSGVSKALIAKKAAGLPIVSITSDLQGSTGVKDFQAKFPESTFDVGVAEANMVSVAAGFSKTGYIPVVDTFAQFGVTKGALPITMANLSQSPIIAFFSHTGFQDAADGASHQALSYISMQSSIPNVYVFTLSCSSEAEALVSQALDEFAADRKNGKTPKTYIFFLGRENFPASYKENVSYQLHKSQVLMDTADLHSKKVCILAVGSMVPEAIKASQILQEQKIGVSLLQPSAINHPDLSTIEFYVAKCGGKLLVVEDHQRIGGFASILTQSLKENRLSFELKVLAVNGKFGQSAYSAAELYSKHHLDADHIVQTIKESLL
ncbi:MAG: transketolase [Bdellovibrionales bacterium]|nr:transketolase [Bdellovibrionales bacterium]